MSAGTLATVVSPPEREREREEVLGIIKDKKMVMPANTPDLEYSIVFLKTFKVLN